MYHTTGYPNQCRQVLRKNKLTFTIMTTDRDVLKQHMQMCEQETIRELEKVHADLVEKQLHEQAANIRKILDDIYKRIKGNK
jgi:hypothetical protein